MKIGVTSQNFRTITGHAGKTRRFLVFQSDGTAESVREVDRLDLSKEMSMHAFHGMGSHPIEVLDILITGSCGEGFIRRMSAMGIRVFVTGESDPLTAARAVVEGTPLPPPRPHDHAHS
jgi:predicted Fe-Mo cluster-binding NifX family protein